ncbi:MAG: RAD55 family ATPase [Nitrososphaerales archaeon]
MAGELERTTTKVEPLLLTGLDALDRMLGGIPNGSVVVLYGRPGSGFDIFAQQILFNRSSSDEVKSLYFTIEHPTEDISSEMLSRDWDVDRLIEEKRWEFLDAFRIRSSIRKGVAGSKVLLDALSSYTKKIGQEVWSALDTFSYYLLHYKTKEITGHVDDIISRAREHGGLHFLLIVEGMIDPQIVTNLAHLTDGLFKFGLDPEQTDAVGVIRIEKLRKADYVTRMIPYRITDSGLAIETSVRMA